MTKRLQVLLDDDELHRIQRLAKEQRLTTAEWVRQSLRASAEAATLVNLEEKLAAIRQAVRYEFPTAGIDQMLAEIERGYGVIDE
jgi:predicted transcriptional regulator